MGRLNSLYWPWQRGGFVAFQRPCSPRTRRTRRDIASNLFDGPVETFGTLTALRDLYVTRGVWMLVCLFVCFVDIGTDYSHLSR